MIDEQLFERVIDTLKENNDAVVIAVADKKLGASRIYFSGSDLLLVPLIDALQGAYVEDVVKDMSDKQDLDLDKAIEDALNEIDWEQFDQGEGEEHGKN